jgi:hypothetical protein
MAKEFKIKVTKLAADGSNRVMYCDRMLWAIDSRGWGERLLTMLVTQAFTDAGTVDGVSAQITGGSMRLL